MKRYTINSQPSLSTLIGDLRELFNEIHYFTVSISTGKKRTLPQNAISHRWYNQVSEEEREYTPEEVKCLCIMLGTVITPGGLAFVSPGAELCLCHRSAPTL